MKTFVMEEMPELFWEMVHSKNWQKFFTKRSEIAEIVIIRTKTIFNKKLFTEFPFLKYIIRAGSGIDNIDLKEAHIRNIGVINTPKANAIAAAEHTLSIILNLLKQHQIGKNAILSGTWKEELTPNWELSEIKALIVGVGNVGTIVAKNLRLLGSEVRGVDPYLSQKDWECKQLIPVSFEEGLKWCNLISFHCPLSLETKNYFSMKTLKKTINPIWLINTSRGEVINTKTVSFGLKNKMILGVGLDVFSKEPCEIQQFMHQDNVFISPHVGAFTKPAKQRLSAETLEVWKNLNLRK